MLTRGDGRVMPAAPPRELPRSKPEQGCMRGTCGDRARGSLGISLSRKATQRHAT